MMSNQVKAIPPIPAETARIAKAIFGRSNFYIQAGEHLETTLKDIESESLLEEGAILPQITFFQFLEGLTDAQASDAVRARIDWKFALHLPVYSPEFRNGALCEFRQMVLIEPECQSEFQKLIDRLLLFDHRLNNRFQNFKILELVSIVCLVNRQGLIYEAICQALEVLACRFPGWLQKIALPYWYGRYNRTVSWLDSTALLYQQELSIHEMGADIHHLLEEVRRSGFYEIEELHEVKMLDQIWAQQFEKPSHLMNDQRKFSKLNSCDFCIHKERGNLLDF